MTKHHEPPLEAWATMAMQHWKEWQPKRYRQLMDAGDLEQEAMAAAKLTWGEMKVWLMQGASWDEAWEASRELFLLSKPKGDEEEGESMPRSEAYAAICEENFDLERDNEPKPKKESST